MPSPCPRAMYRKRRKQPMVMLAPGCLPKRGVPGHVSGGGIQGGCTPGGQNRDRKPTYTALTCHNRLYVRTHVGRVALAGGPAAAPVRIRPRRNSTEYTVRLLRLTWQPQTAGGTTGRATIGRTILNEGTVRLGRGLGPPSLRQQDASALPTGGEGGGGRQPARSAGAGEGWPSLQRPRAGRAKGGLRVEA